MFQLSTFLAFASIAVPSALAAPLRGPSGLEQPRIFMTPDVFGQPTFAVTYEIEESTPNENFGTGFGQPSMFPPSYGRLDKGPAIAYPDERALTSGGFPFVFGSSRLGGQSLTENLLKLMGLTSPAESTFAVSGPTRVLFAREDHKDEHHDEKPKEEKPKSGIAAVGAWFANLGKNIRKGFEKLVHPHKEGDKDPKHNEHKPTTTTLHSPTTSAKPTATQPSSTAPTPAPAAGAQPETTDKPEDPAAPQTAETASTPSAAPAEPTA